MNVQVSAMLLVRSVSEMGRGGGLSRRRIPSGASLFERAMVTVIQEWTIRGSNTFDMLDGHQLNILEIF
jgi:hypothetical protein